MREYTSTLNKTGMDSYYYGSNAEVVSATRMADAKNYYEPARKNNFEFAVYGLEGIAAAGTNITNGNSLTFNDTDIKSVIRMTVNSAFEPHFSQKEITIKRGNNEIKYAGVPTFGSGSLKIYDTIGAETKDLLMAWQNCSYNVKTEKVGLATDYKKKAYLTEYTPDWQKIRTWVLEGCWITDLKGDDPDWSSGEAKSISATIMYDRAYIDYSDYISTSDTAAWQSQAVQ